MSNPVPIRFPDGMLDALDTARAGESRSAWVIAAVSAALGAGSAPVPVASGSGALAGGVPCGGVACSHSGCWARDTARYGDPHDFGGLILCMAHAHDAVGLRYARPRTEQRDRTPVKAGQNGHGS